MNEKLVVSKLCSDFKVEWNPKNHVRIYYATATQSLHPKAILLEDDPNPQVDSLMEGQCLYLCRDKENLYAVSGRWYSMHRENGSEKELVFCQFDDGRQSAFGWKREEGEFTVDDEVFTARYVLDHDPHLDLFAPISWKTWDNPTPMPYYSYSDFSPFQSNIVYAKPKHSTESNSSLKEKLRSKVAQLKDLRASKRVKK